MTPLAWFRLAVTAFSVAAVQALLVEQAGAVAFRHLDLPLAVAIALVLTRPADSVAIGFLFGLAVDLFQYRLFGLHALAFCTLAPIAANLPVSALRSRAEVVIMLTAAQTVAATSVLVTGVWLVDGRMPGGLFGRFVQVTVWSVLLVLWLSAALGGRMGLAVPGSAERPPAPTSAEWT